MRVQDKAISAIAVSAFFALTALVFAPGHLFLTNAGEFNATYSEFLRHSLLVALPVFVLLAAVLTFLTERHGVHQKVTALILMLSFLLWLQGNYLVWDYEVLTGSEIEFNAFFLILDGLIWTTLIIVALLGAGLLYRHVRFLSCVFIVLQVISTSVMVFDQPDLSDLKRYAVDDTNKFTFSEERNVIILVLDTFQSDMFRTIVDDDQSYRDIFDGFTYYRDALGGFPTTKGAVPNILTGQYYDNSIPYSEFLREAYVSSTSVPGALLKAGFRVEYCGSGSVIYLDKKTVSNLVDRQRIEASTLYSIYDAALFRYLPDVLKKHVYNDGRWLLSDRLPVERSTVDSGSGSQLLIKEPGIQFESQALTIADVSFIRGMLTDSNTVGKQSVFKYYHLRGPHPPYTLNESLQYEEMSGMDGYERQAKASLQIARLFLDELKELEAFDSSLIFIVGDHGRTSTTLKVEEANPLFLVKRIGGHGSMTVSDARVCLSDIPATIFAELGMEGDYSGESIFAVDEADSRIRRYLYYNWHAPGFDRWNVDWLPPMDEYVVTGRVLSPDSWKLVRRLQYQDSSAGLSIEWGDGFSLPVGSGSASSSTVCRYGCSQATLTINNNLDHDITYMITTDFFSGDVQPCDLRITSELFDDTLQIDSFGSYYIREITIPPGQHLVTFSCDAPTLLDSEDSSWPYVFEVTDFQILEGGLAYNGQLNSIILRWSGGFHALEGTPEKNWRWCSSDGTLAMFNPSNSDRTYTLKASFVTGHPEPANLRIKSTVLNEDLLISNEGYDYERQLVIPPGRHVITFASDAERLHAPNDPRYIVFGTRNFQMVEID